MTSMPDGNTAALKQYEEQQRDAERDVQAYKQAALDDLVWRVMENEKGRPFDLMDFVHEQDDMAELIVTGLLQPGPWGWIDMKGIIESRLRAKLEGSEAVEERALAMARDE